MENASLEKIRLIGIKTTADNSQNFVNISRLWEEFFRNDIMGKIPDKRDNMIYAVYTDYESNEKGKYSFMIGCETGDDSPVPEGMFCKIIEKANYCVFREKGNIAAKIPEMWNRIWNMDLNRKFSADFEIYNAENMMGENADIEIYIGVN